MKVWPIFGLSLMLTACGGGSSNQPEVPPPSGSQGGANTGSGSGWVAGQYDPIRDLEAICANPRSSGGYNDLLGTTTDENFWIRSFSNDTYLWYRELEDIDPGTIDTTEEYFDLMRTDALTASGNYKINSTLPMILRSGFSYLSPVFLPGMAGSYPLLPHRRRAA